MPPKYSEKDIEDNISFAQNEFKLVNSKLTSLRNETINIESQYVEWRIKIDNLNEELRIFRLKYPKLCKINYVK